MRRAAPPRPHNRAGIWYLIRRVPKEFTELDRRGIVYVSTDIAVADDPRAVRARAVVTRLNDNLEAYWHGLRDGQSAEARLRYEAAQRRARRLGLAYRTTEELAAPETSTDELLRRIQLLVDRGTKDDEAEVAAVLGGEARPALKLSGLLEEVEELQATALAALSPNQRRKWQNPRKRAIDSFIAAIGGDLEITALRREHGLIYRRWWQDRIANEGIDIGTANKAIGHVSRSLRVVNIAHQYELPPIFSGLRLEGQVSGQRTAFTPEFVQDRILAEGALDALNEEARHILYLIAETGLRLSEACNLLPHHIHLEAKVPFVEVRAEGRVLKQAHTAREIPLVGVALKAMTLHPDGFPRYRDKGDSLSAIINKVLKSQALLPTDNHSAYSLRHTFEDRLTAVEAPEKVVAMLMGHKWIRPKYGVGPSLEQKRRWLERIAFKPPARL